MRRLTIWLLPDEASAARFGGRVALRPANEPVSVPLHVTVCSGYSALDDTAVATRLGQVARETGEALVLRPAGAIEAPDPRAPGFVPFEALYLPVEPAPLAALRAACPARFEMERVHAAPPHMSLGYGHHARDVAVADAGAGPLRFVALEVRVDHPELDLADRMRSWAGIARAPLGS